MTRAASATANAILDFILLLPPFGISSKERPADVRKPVPLL
jgi:hypothetical protein